MRWGGGEEGLATSSHVGDQPWRCVQQHHASANHILGQTSVIAGGIAPEMQRRPAKPREWHPNKHEETAIGPEANVALVIKGIIKGIDKLLRGAGMEDAVRKDVSEMHTLSFTTHALVARLQTYTDPSPMHPNSQGMFHSCLSKDQRPVHAAGIALREEFQRPPTTPPCSRLTQYCTVRDDVS